MGKKFLESHANLFEKQRNFTFNNKKKRSVHFIGTFRNECSENKNFAKNILSGISGTCVVPLCANFSFSKKFII